MIRKFLLLLVTVGVSVAVLVHGREGAGASRVSVVRPSVSQLGLKAPLAAALLSQAQAVTFARESGWGTLIARGKDMSVSFGSYDRHMSIHGVLTPVSDVLAITLGGYDFPAPRPLVDPVTQGTPTAGPDMHYLTVYIDDKTGQEVSASMS